MYEYIKYIMSKKTMSKPISPPDSPIDKMMSSGTNTDSFGRYMRKTRGKKPESAKYNREMNIARGEEITKLKQEISDLKLMIKDRDEYLNRLYDWNLYSNTKPPLCNKKARMNVGKLKKGTKKKKKKGSKKKKGGNYSKRRSKRRTKGR